MYGEMGYSVAEACVRMQFFFCSVVSRFLRAFLNCIRDVKVML